MNRSRLYHYSCHYALMLSMRVSYQILVPDRVQCHSVHKQDTEYYIIASQTILLGCL